MQNIARAGAVNFDNEVNVGSQIVGFVVQTTCSGGIGALAGHLFSIIDPIGGAVFGATYSLASKGTNFLLEKANFNKLPEEARAIVKAVLSFFISVAVAAAVTTAVGFTVTTTAALVLPLLSTITAFGVVILGSCAACACCFGIAAR